MEWIILIIAIAAIFYFDLNRYIALGATAVLLIVLGMAHLAGPFSQFIFWVLYIATAVFIVGTPLRRQFITKPFMAWFMAQQPHISKSEREVLEAGNLWWEQYLFKGSPDWSSLESLAKPNFSAEEQSFLDKQLKTLCNMLDEWKISNELNDLPKEAWDYIKQERFWGIVTPKSYGGLEFSSYLHSQVVATLASRSLTAALTVMVPNSLGPAEFLQHYGTEEQKTYYLPRLACGEDIACFALTAPNAGSDATGLTDRGEVCEGEYEGKKVLGIRLTFDKRYITLAPIATLIGLAFKLYDPNHLLGDVENIGITLALVPATCAGVEQGSRHDPMGFSFMNGPVRGQDVFIPVDFIIGGIENRGKGWRMLMECLSVGRSISLPALAAGSAQLAYRTSSAYAVLREQFHRSIGEFDGIKEQLATVGGLTYALEATRWFTLQAVEEGLRPSIASAIAKYQTTEMSRIIVNAAMDIHGGRAIQDGPKNYLANIYRSLPIFITVEGANILTRCLIIFGQGALRCHPYLEQEISFAEEGKLAEFDNVWLKHIGYIGRNKMRSFVQGLMGTFGDHQRQLNRLSYAFAFVSDTTMAVLGKNLKIREAVSGRLADIFSYLYVCASILKYDANNKGGELMVEWAMQYFMHKIQEAFLQLFANYPKRWLGRLLRFTVFPYGACYHGPNDALSQQVAEFMQHDTEFRQCLTSACYIGDNADCPVGSVERAWSKIEQTDADQLQGKLLDEINRLRWNALQVDEFEGAY